MEPEAARVHLVDGFATFPKVAQLEKWGATSPAPSRGAMAPPWTRAGTSPATPAPPILAPARDGLRVVGRRAPSLPSARCPADSPRWLIGPVAARCASGGQGLPPCHPAPTRWRGTVPSHWAGLKQGWASPWMPSAGSSSVKPLDDRGARDAERARHRGVAHARMSRREVSDKVALRLATLKRMPGIFVEDF